MQYFHNQSSMHTISKSILLVHYLLLNVILPKTFYRNLNFNLNNYTVTSFETKMNITKFIIIFHVVCILIQTSAHISINIDNDDYNQVSAFFNNIIINRAGTPTVSRCSILTTVKKITCTVFQMLGILITLTASNLLTVKS